MGTSARDRASLLPLAPGVYRFRDVQGRVLYLGRATSLRRRVASYWGDLKGRVHLAPMMTRVANVEAVACDSVHEAAWLERNLLLASLPRWNRAPAGGQEVEVWIRLSDDARVPGVAVVHERTGSHRHFGPYLGGNQARLAVSGLCRVLPLNYAAGGLTGTRLDLARLRGVSAADRAALADTAAAVLDRDPAAAGALRASLVGRRDAASAALAFELAARLQQEIEALDYVLGEQKVTSRAPTDCDVAGWSAGIGVTFAIRGGRLVGWGQRRCAEADAARNVRRTPPAWAAFAQRNAELAALLAEPRSPANRPR